MSKIVFSAALALSVLFVFGCTDDLQDERYLQNENVNTDGIFSPSVMEPEAAEVDLVEEMAMYRNNYKASLHKMINYYSRTGDQTNLYRARNELKSYNSMPKYKYMMEAQIAGPELKAIDLIVEADELYEQANDLYKEATALKLLIDKDKMRLALSKFNELISLYPTSNKIDDAAYKAGRIYDYFKDYNIAVIYYQRAYQWNPNTRYPARIYAAYVMDKRLKDKEKALELYKLAAKFGMHPKNVEFAKERIVELTAGDERLDNDRSAVENVDFENSDASKQ